MSVLGSALRQIIPKMVGQNITNWFELIKPLVEFKWEVNKKYRNKIAENIVNIFSSDPAIPNLQTLH